MNALDPKLFRGDRYAVAPEVLLAPDGPRKNAVMLVEDGEIKTVTDTDSFRREFADLTVGPLPGTAIVPGFIDAHIHLGQGFGKAIIGGEPSQIWQRIWIPLEGGLDPELTEVCAKWMLLEALRGGFTSVVNFAIVNREKTEAIHRAASETGVRVVSSTGAVNKADYVDVTGQSSEFKRIDEALSRAEAHLSSCDAQPGIYPSL